MITNDILLERMINKITIFGTENIARELSADLHSNQLVHPFARRPTQDILERRRKISLYTNHSNTSLTFQSLDLRCQEVQGLTSGTACCQLYRESTPHSLKTPKSNLTFHLALPSTTTLTNTNNTSPIPHHPKRQQTTF